MLPYFRSANEAPRNQKTRQHANVLKYPSTCPSIPPPTRLPKRPTHTSSLASFCKHLLKRATCAAFSHRSFHLELVISPGRASAQARSAAFAAFALALAQRPFLPPRCAQQPLPLPVPAHQHRPLTPPYLLTELRPPHRHRRSELGLLLQHPHPHRSLPRWVCLLLPPLPPCPPSRQSLSPCLLWKLPPALLR